MTQKTPHIRDLKNKENISQNMIKVNNKNTNTIKYKTFVSNNQGQISKI